MWTFYVNPLADDSYEMPSLVNCQVLFFSGKNRMSPATILLNVLRV